MCSPRYNGIFISENHTESKTKPFFIVVQNLRRNVFRCLNLVSLVQRDISKSCHRLIAIYHFSFKKPWDCKHEANNSKKKYFQRHFFSFTPELKIPILSKNNLTKQIKITHFVLIYSLNFYLNTQPLTVKIENSCHFF